MSEILGISPVTVFDHFFREKMRSHWGPPPKVSGALNKLRELVVRTNTPGMGNKLVVTSVNCACRVIIFGQDICFRLLPWYTARLLKVKERGVSPALLRGREREIGTILLFFFHLLILKFLIWYMFFTLICVCIYLRFVYNSCFKDFFCLYLYKFSLQLCVLWYGNPPEDCVFSF